jgi:hypothetical protein
MMSRKLSGKKPSKATRFNYDTHDKIEVYSRGQDETEEVALY